MSTEKISLALEPRQVTGKKVKALRAAGHVPGTIYGHDLEPINVMADTRAVEKVYQQAGKHHPVEVTIDGKKRLTMIKAVDTDPVKRGLRHVSFHAVKQNEKVEAEIPVVLIGEGESAAEKVGLVVLQAIDSLMVKALPLALPDQLEVSIVHLTEAGDRVTIADIKLPEGVELDTDDTELVIANVYEPSALAAANDAAGGDATDEDVATIEAENGEDTPQGGADQEENPGGEKAAQDKSS